MFHKIRNLIILGVILVLLIVGITILYISKYETEYSVIDQDSGVVVLHNSSSDKIVAAETPVKLLSGSRLLDSGMTDQQYAQVTKTITMTITDSYGKKYNLASINTASITHPSDDTYVFKVRLGENGSNVYIFVTVTTSTTDNTLAITIKDATGTILKEAKALKVV